MVGGGGGDAVAGAGSRLGDWRTIALSLGAAFMVLGGCSGPGASDETGILLVVEADQAVRERVRRLEVFVEGMGAAGAGSAARRPVQLPQEGGLRWPQRGAIVPEGGDASRRFRVTVLGYEGDGGAPIVSTRAESGFVEGSWRRLELWLLSRCIGVTCGAMERCVDGACEMLEPEDPERLPRARPEEQGNACSSDAECDDGAPCTVDWCLEGRCVSSQPPDGSLAFRQVAIAPPSNRSTYAGSRTCAVDVLGRLWCWGGANARAVGERDVPAERLRPQRVPDMEGVLEVGLGPAYGWEVVVARGVLGAWRFPMPACRLDDAGEVECPPVGAASRIPIPGRVLQASAGIGHQCFLTADGAAWCRGDNLQGAVNGIASPSGTGPLPVEHVGGSPPPPPFRTVRTGGYGSFALTEDGEFWQWGRIFYDDTGPGSNPTEIHPNRTVHPIREACHGNGYANGGWVVYAIDEAGRFRWFMRSELEPDYWVSAPMGATRIPLPEQLASLRLRTLACREPSCVVDVAGRTWCWGRNERGQLGRGHFDPPDDPQPLGRVEGLEQVVRLTTTGGSACAIDVSGRLWCWGANGDGQLGLGDREDRSRPTRVGAELRCP